MCRRLGLGRWNQVSFRGHCGLRIRLGGERRAAIDPRRTLCRPMCELRLKRFRMRRAIAIRRLSLLHCPREAVVSMMHKPLTRGGENRKRSTARKPNRGARLPVPRRGDCNVGRRPAILPGAARHITIARQRSPFHGWRILFHRSHQPMGRDHYPTARHTCVLARSRCPACRRRQAGVHQPRRAAEARRCVAGLSGSRAGSAVRHRRSPLRQSLSDRSGQWLQGHAHRVRLRHDLAGCVSPSHILDLIAILAVPRISGSGTNAKCRPRRAMSEFGGKAENIYSE